MTGTIEVLLLKQDAEESEADEISEWISERKQILVNRGFLVRVTFSETRYVIKG